MTEFAGDAVSRLVQLHAQRNGVRLKWTGKGGDDVSLLCVDIFNKTALSQCLWNGIKELMGMPEIKDLPEPIQAKIYSIVLQAQANFELQKPPTIIGASA
ncbi:MAG TPA: hypothetical protein VNZ53_19285 [Steroidobacteraceae bacterium]|jgi:hypothetical protein|nr:hypothetical protein [Steroidobacteraceae bacterium]